MRRKLTSFGKSHREFPSMQISFLTRAKAMEICFGDPTNDEANIAASILRSLMQLGADVRVLVCQNIVLAGGSCMVPGFKLRLTQEMNYLIENYQEFQELDPIKDKIKIPDS